jgi:hypothetical protein
MQCSASNRVLQLAWLATYYYCRSDQISRVSRIFSLLNWLYVDVGLDGRGGRRHNIPCSWLLDLPHPQALTWAGLGCA